MNRSLSLVLVIAITLVIIVGMVYFFVIVPQNAQVVDDGPAVELVSPRLALFETPAEDRTPSQTKFQDGFAFESKKDYEGAANAFREALALTNDPEEAAHIEYRIARAEAKFDPFAAADGYKSVIANEAYPSLQKAYAAMWLTLLNTEYSDRELEQHIYSGEPYEGFYVAGDSVTTSKNLYEFSLLYGSTGVADFHVARWYARQLLTNGSLDLETVLAYEGLVDTLLEGGNNWVDSNRDDEINNKLMPVVLRARAKAYAELAKTGNEEAREAYPAYAEEAIDAGLANRQDGAARFDYFLAGYEIYGTESFADTQKHIDILFNNIADYPSMLVKFEVEQENRYGAKSRYVALANENEAFKGYLINIAGWTEADF